MNQIKHTRPFSFRERLRSIRYAYEGIEAFISAQHNAIIHFYVTAFVFMAAIFFKVSTLELIMLAFAAGFVWCAEIFNTAIESMMDHLSPERHPRVKYIKDLAAGAVLVAAITAIIIGLVIFIPKIF